MTSSFRIELQGSDPASVKPAPPGRESSGEFDYEHIRLVLAELCRTLASDPRVRFLVRFSDEDWPVDVSTDLAVVLEQLPAVAKVSDEPFELSFFEQGLERTMNFRPLGNGLLEVLCTTWSVSWTAPESPVVIRQDALRDCFRELAVRFVDLAVAVRPDVLQHESFRSWRQVVCADLDTVA